MTSGNPANQSPEVKRYAYLLFDVSEPTLRDGFDVMARGYVPADPPHPGTVLLREDNPGTGTHAFEIEDGPWFWLTQGVYIGTGRDIPGTDTVEFDNGVQWLLEMVAAGVGRELEAKRVVHQFADLLKEGVEGRPWTSDDLIKQIDQAKQLFFKVR